MVVSAVRVAKQVDGPVKVVWTREEDVQHDYYRPSIATPCATLSDGKIVGWKYKVAGSAILARWLPPAFQKGIDIECVDAAVDMPYDFRIFTSNLYKSNRRRCRPRFWRGVGRTTMCSRSMCMMDELARKAGKDPGRISPLHARKGPRFLAVLNMRRKKRLGRELPARAVAAVCLQASLRALSRPSSKPSRSARRSVDATDRFGGRHRNRRQSDTVIAQLEGD